MRSILSIADTNVKQRSTPCSVRRQFCALLSAYWYESKSIGTIAKVDIALVALAPNQPMIKYVISTAVTM